MTAPPDNRAELEAALREALEAIDADITKHEENLRGMCREQAERFNYTPEVEAANLIVVRAQAAIVITYRHLLTLRAALSSPTSDHSRGLEEADVERVGAAGSYAEWQQRRGMLADKVDWAILEYDEFMKDDAYNSQHVLDRIVEGLRQARDKLKAGEA